MDQETTPAAPSAPVTPPTTPEASPRRVSTWGKVQVKPKEAPAEPKPARAPRAAAPTTERAPAPSREAEERAPADGDTPDVGGSSGAPSRRRSRGGRGRGGGGSRPTETTTERSDDDATEPAATVRTPKPRPAPKPKVPTDTTDTTDTTDPGEEPTTDESTAERVDGEAPSTGPKKRRRRRGGRGRGGKKPTTVDVGGDDGLAGETAATQRDDATPDVDATGNGQQRRRRSGQGGGEPAAKKPSKPKSIEEQIAAGGPTRGIRSTRTRTGRDGRRRRDPVAPPPRITDKLMVITERGERDQIAVLEEDVLVQHYVTRAGATSMVGNVYLGRVQNVLPGMEAAFVDVGRGRNGVLYAGEVNYSPEDLEGPAQRIEQLLKPGQAVMVQVTKDPMGGKGARLTANLSLAGRYIVLAPNQNLQGISRRLGDDARKRLKSMLKRVKPPEHGVIVRTAAEAATEEELETDLRRLLDIWNDIQAKAKKGKAPTGLYEEPELTVRVVRDLFTDEEYRGLVTDSQRVYDKISGYLGEVAPDLAQKVTLHSGPLPAFEEHRLVEQIHKALDKKVWLPSGGYLFIERTEAMTIVDVNTGKSVGKTNLEETVVNTNLEAAREVARQLRLRDIGGIIVVDFIDMLLDKNKKQVEDTMRDALAIDKTRSQVFEIGPLGLMQVTRKRVSSGLVESFSETCPTCEGRGILLTYDVD
ncbi:MAG: Rne/Rng family ribonuclease [Actinomycetota bacterium]